MSWFTSWFSSQKTGPVSPAAETGKRLLEEPTPQPPIVVDAPTAPAPPSAQPANPHRNKVVFGAGLAFLAFSTIITRRSFARKRLAANPAFYANGPGHQAEQAAKVSGPMEALEALNIATINVLSIAMVAVGGSMWYLDINSMEEARRKLRGGLGVDGTGRSEKDAEEEFEEWMATTLARKDDKISRRTETTERGQKR